MAILLINNDTGLGEQFESNDAAQTALQAGTHGVPLTDPQGNPSAASLTDAPQLLQQGYTQPTAGQLQSLNTYAEKSTPGQQAITALEGVGRGLTPITGLSTGIERLLGVNPDDIRQREEVNPGIHALGEMGGLGLGALYGSTELKALGAAGEGVAGLAGLGEASGFIGGAAKAAVKGATEMTMMQGGNEISRFFASDPQQSWETAASHLGSAALFGGAFGGALGVAGGGISKLWNAAEGSKVGQMIEDFKGRVQERMENPNPTEAVQTQLSDYYKNVNATHDEVFGAKGLKAQAIADKLPEMNDAITGQSQEFSDKLGKAVSDLREADDPFASRLERAANKWQSEITAPGVDSGAIFDATNDLKQQLQEWGKYNKQFVPLAEKDFRDAAKSLAFDIRTGLENPDVWGEAAGVQQKINKAFSNYLPAMKDFEKRFTTEVAGERVIDPSKVNTYMNQLGKPSAEIKQEMLGNFRKASDEYVQKINEIHSELGSTSPFQHTPMNAVDATLNEVTPGARLADNLINRGLAKTSGRALGAGLGHITGIGGWIGSEVFGPALESVIPGMVKPLLDRAANADGLRSAISLGNAVQKGEVLLTAGTKAVFDEKKPVLPNHLMPTESSIEKLKGQLDQLQKDQRPMLDVSGSVGHYLPNHATAIGTTAARALTYLQTLKPNTDKNAPMDGKKVANSMQEARYNQALKIVQSPLTVLDKLKAGRLSSQDLATMSAVYPGLLARMQSKMVERVVDMQSKGKQIPYNQRLGLSLMLGTPLDSTMTPQAAMQMRPPPPAPMPAPKAPRGQGGPGTANQKGLQNLGKSSVLNQTPNQQAEARRMLR